MYNGRQVQFSLILTALSCCFVGFILFYLLVFCLVSSTILGLLFRIHFLFIILSALVCIVVVVLVVIRTP